MTAAQRLAALDVAVARALLDVDGRAATQLRVLGAYEALAASLPDDGVLRPLVNEARAQRLTAFTAYHERRLAAAVGRDVDAFDQAIAFTRGTVGDGPEVRALEEARAAALSSSPPVPFFARFLERQER